MSLRTQWRQRCAKCKTRRYQIVNSFVAGELRICYIGCRGCGHRPSPNKLIIPLDFAPRRAA